MAFSLLEDHGRGGKGIQQFLALPFFHPGGAWEELFLETPLSPEVTDVLRKL